MVAVCGREEELHRSTGGRQTDRDDLPLNGLLALCCVAGEKRHRFLLRARGKRTRELIATERITKLMMVVVTEDDEISGMSRTVGMHLVGMVCLDELLSILCERHVAAFGR